MGKQMEPIKDLPGWYQHPLMFESLCFWDGDDWTEEYAPLPSRMDQWLLVRVIALGTAIGGVLAAFVMFILLQ